MENINIVNNNNGFSGIAQTKDTASSAEIALSKVPESNKASENNVERDPNQARFEAVKQAAQKVHSKLPFSALNARFTIYRDTSSENLAYVTRFTNLDSGEVKIIREPELLSIGSPGNGAVLNGLI